MGSAWVSCSPIWMRCFLEGCCAASLMFVSCFLSMELTSPLSEFCPSELEVTWGSVALGGLVSLRPKYVVMFKRGGLCVAWRAGMLLRIKGAL